MATTDQTAGQQFGQSFDQLPGQQIAAQFHATLPPPPPPRTAAQIVAASRSTFQPPARLPIDRLRDAHASTGIWLARAAAYHAAGDRHTAHDFLRAAEWDCQALLRGIREAEGDLRPPEVRD